MTIKAVPLQQRLPSSTLPHANLFSTRLQNELIYIFGVCQSVTACVFTQNIVFTKFYVVACFAHFACICVYAAFNSTVNLFFLIIIVVQVVCCFMIHYCLHVGLQHFVIFLLPTLHYLTGILNKK